MGEAVALVPRQEIAIPQSREPRLLVEWPSASQDFFGNLRDLIRPQNLPPLQLRSAPAPFWSDVFVKSAVPWRRFFESAGYHVIALGLLLSLAHLIAMRRAPVPAATFDRAQIVYYQPAEYLPPLNTLRPDASDDSSKPQKSDPLPSPQPIISVPAEADNLRQTIVSPPNVKLKRDLALPNVVAWQENAWREKPLMPIAPAPLIPAASIARLNPELNNSVIAPPPDAAHASRRRDSPRVPQSVVAPPPDAGATIGAAFQTPRPAVIEPPPNVGAVSWRAPGDLNIGHTQVIAPAPQLSLAAQRAISGTRGSATRVAAQVVPPPPSLTRGAGTGSAGSSNRGTPLIALSLHPTVGAPLDPPSGNRRGTFAATPDGKPGASGAPGSLSGHTVAGGNGGKGKDNPRGSSANTASNALPAGLFVGKPDQPNSAAMAGDPSAARISGHDSVNPKLLASARPPRITAQPPHPLQPGNESKLSEAERQVFGSRKFYSLTLNMPNLNSAGGSWVIRFAEMRQTQSTGSSPASLSAPAALRKVDPAYPLQLMRENVTGTVILYAVIHANGSVGDVRVLRSVDDRIDQFASQAVARWQFEPATKNGAPVDVEATFQIPFRATPAF